MSSGSQGAAVSRPGEAACTRARHHAFAGGSARLSDGYRRQGTWLEDATMAQHGEQRDNDETDGVALAPAQLVPAPGSPSESRQLRQLRALQDVRSGERRHVGEQDADTPLHPSSTASTDSGSSHLSGGSRIVTQESGPDGVPVETELYWREDRLVWSRSGVVYRTFTYDERVQCAAWSWLDVGQTWEEEEEGEEQCARSHARALRRPPQLVRALCIMLPSHLVIHLPHSGHEYTKRLDFNVLTVIPLDVGLLVQRSVEREDRKRGQGEPFRDMASAENPATEQALPSLFYLRRPLDELRAVQLAQQIMLPASANQHLKTPKLKMRMGEEEAYFNTVDERILFSAPVRNKEEGCNILVTANYALGRIRIYSLVHGRAPIATVVTAQSGSQTAHARPSMTQARRPSEKFFASRHRTRQSSGGDMAGMPASRPRLSSAPRARPSIGSERSRASSGASRRVSSGLGGAPGGAVYGQNVFAATNSEDSFSFGENGDVREMMQFLGDLEEVNEDHNTSLPSEHQQQQVRASSGHAPSTVQRRTSRTSAVHQPPSFLHPTSVAQATIQPMAHILRTPFAKGQSLHPDERRTITRASRNSIAVADSNTTQSVAATLSQRDEASKLTLSVSRFGPRATQCERGISSGDPNIDIEKSLKRKNHPLDDNRQELEAVITDRESLFDSFGRGFAAVSLIDEIEIPEIKSIPHCKFAINVVSNGEKTSLFVFAEQFGRLYTRELAKAQGKDEEQVLECQPVTLCKDEPFVQAAGMTLLKERKRHTDLLLQEQHNSSLSRLLLAPLNTLSWKESVSIRNRQNFLKPRCALTRRVLEACDMIEDADVVKKLRTLYITRMQQTGNADEWTELCNALRGYLAETFPEVHSECFKTMLHSPSNTSTGASFPFSTPLSQAASAPMQAKMADDTGKLCNEDLTRIVTAMHGIAQDAQLDNVENASFLPKLIPLLVDLCKQLGWTHHVEYWKRRVGRTDADGPYVSRHGAVAEPAVYDSFALLNSLMQDDTRENNMPLPPLRFARTAMLCDIFAAFCGPKKEYLTINGSRSSPEASTAKAVVDVILCFKKFEMTMQRLSFLVALPLLEAIKTCQLEPPEMWSARAYSFVGREDLAATIREQTPSAHDGHTRTYQGVFGQTPSMPKLHAICLKLFNDDYRLSDVGQMLQTKSAIATRGPPDTVGSADEDFIAEKQKRVFVSATERIKATSVGRGMLLIGTDKLNTTEQPKVAPLNTKIRMLCNCIVQHREPDPESAEMEWPEFHNGAAAALQLAASDVAIESSWIFSQTNNEFTPRNAGFIFGLGLQGFLRNLGKVHAHHYLSQRHPMTTMGLLLGISVSFMGSCDVMAKALMSIHLIHTLPMYSKPLKTTMLEQSAALVGLGFVFMGSKDRWAIRMALKALSTDVVMTDDNQMKKRACYALSAGFSLGLVCLGQGRKEKQSLEMEREVVSPLGDMIKQFSNEQNSSHKMDIDTDFSKTENYAAYEWRPEISLTSTPASIALALIYLRSGRQDIADKLALPQTSAQLDEIRPELLQIRVLSRALILWDDIKPTTDWLDEALPEILRFQHPREVKLASQTRQLAYWTLRTGGIFALGLKYAGSHNPFARDCLMKELDAHQAADGHAVSYFEKLRQQALRSSIDVILTCLAMVMAGSGDIQLLTIFRKALYKVEGTRYGNYMASTMSLGVLFLGGGRLTFATSDVAIAALLLAFYPRYPINSVENYTHLQAYRHFWILAIEPRLINVEEGDTGRTKATPIEVHLRDEGLSSADRVLHMTTPCLLPKLDTIASIRLGSHRYYPMMLNIEKNLRHRRSLVRTQTLYVKRRAAYLDHESDPSGRASLAACMQGQSIAYDTQILWPESDRSSKLHYFKHLQRSITTETVVGALPPNWSGLHDFLASSDPMKAVEADSAARLAYQALVDCLLFDKPNVLPIVLGMIECTRQYIQISHTSSDANDGPDSFLHNLFYSALERIEAFSQAASDCVIPREGTSRNLERQVAVPRKTIDQLLASMRLIQPKGA